MPGEPSMETLVKNADAADQLIKDINAKIQDIQHRIASKPKEDSHFEQERTRVREEIARWQQYLTLLQIRNGKIYFQKPASVAPVVATTGGGDAPSKTVSVPPAEKKEVPKETANTGTKSQDAPVEAKNKKPSKKEAGADKPKCQATPAPTGDEVVDVGRLDFRIGKIIEVDRHPDADSLYVEKVDVGEANPRTVVSGLVKHVPLEEMKDRMVVLLCNLKPAKMRGVTSEAMVMCASTPEKVEILVPPPGVVPGDLVEFSGITRNADPVLNPKKKIFETVAPDLKTNDEKIATYKGIPFEVKGKGVVSSVSLVNVNIK